MVSIALCDDKHSALQDVGGLLDRYRDQRQVELQYKTYQSPLKLLAELERGARYDVMLLDVLMPGENGIETAAEIRNSDRDVKIIFLTSSAEYAVQSYAVGAYYYLLKPASEDSLFPLLDSVLAACDTERDNSLILRCRGGITRIQLGQMEYCEVIGKTIFFHMTSGRVYESAGNMDKVSDSLVQRGGFFRVHRSYTVNLDYVASITSRAVTLRCAVEIPLPRGKYAQLKDAFLARAFQEGWEDHA